jgi:CheY-like chemotaxis protein
MNHILVADDDPGIRRMLERALHREGYAVETARDGAEALSKIQEETPTLLLLDLSMPVVSGWDVYTRLHNDGSMHVPMVILTAEENIAGARRALPDAEVLAKPFDIDELFTAIERYCGGCQTVETKPTMQASRKQAGSRDRHRVLILTLFLAAVGMLARFIPTRVLPHMLWRACLVSAALGLRVLRLSWSMAGMTKQGLHLAAQAAKTALFYRPTVLRRGFVWR